MYFSDVIYLSFLMILLFIIIYKGFKHQAESHVRTFYHTAETRRQRRPVEIADRQGNIFTIANESSSNPLPHRCTDFFYVEPSSEDAARIRAQLEKDEKDLPTYEEVMAMSAAQAAAGTLSPPPTTASSTTIAITDATVPPYSEIDRNTTRAAPLTLESGATAWPIGNETAPSHGAGAASTSRAAAAAATSAPATTTVVTIANSVSNTSV
ncbi:uncharacterized protein LOC105216042 isoform X8 [Zeugodacus cucurbitae]|uniref:uncharacterized protein LOC105216042 isoform X8 n=1 Tax=Zeugodacus cucurbitae TaxID=28588 RepID=UPI000596A365|nr:uncharacterized protein LOC105216042 isoform X8 [Zeugodacus cucurbitae]